MCSVDTYFIFYTFSLAVISVDYVETEERAVKIEKQSQSTPGLGVERLRCEKGHCAKETSKSVVLRYRCSTETR